jgi:DNA recombination protein rmuC-like protein
VKYPIGEKEIRYLPIDCKFPVMEYSKYYDVTDKNERDKALKDYINKIKSYAKSISEKYIRKDVTTDFA